MKNKFNYITLNIMGKTNCTKKEKSKTNGYTLVGKRFKEVIAEEPKEDNYFRIKNWYY
jgi:hypothetical protein